MTDCPFPAGDYNDLRKGTTDLEDFAAVSTFRQPFTGDDGEPERIRIAGVTPNFFSLPGARIALGRDFTEADGAPQPSVTQQANAPRLPTIAALSHGFWQRRYVGDPRVVGRNIHLGGGSAQVVGVLAPGFELLFPAAAGVERFPDLWTAMRLDFEGSSRNALFLRVVGRLKKGVTVKRAGAGGRDLRGAAPPLSDQADRRDVHPPGADA